jgi:hypothetical protein
MMTDQRIRQVGLWPQSGGNYAADYRRVHPGRHAQAVARVTVCHGPAYGDWVSLGSGVGVGLDVLAGGVAADGVAVTDGVTAADRVADCDLGARLLVRLAGIVAVECAGTRWDTGGSFRAAGLGRTSR